MGQPSISATSSFEDAMSRLQEIAREMDSKTIPLQDLLTRYEEGIQLLKVCDLRLKEAEQRVELITRNAQGEPQLAEFNPEKKPVTGPREDVNLF